MKKNLLILLLVIFSYGLYGQGIFNNGGKIVVGSGTFLNISGTGGNLVNETNVTDGSIDLSGTLKIEGNITNNVISADIFTTIAVGSEVILSGTSPQTIGGSTNATGKYANLNVNNNTGIIFLKNVQVEGTMTFTGGMVEIGNNNFIFGPSAVIAGSPSVSSMIIATGSGQVQKLVSAIGTFTFPVGDNTATAEYSPVSLNFIAGTFAAGAFAGLNLVNAKFDDPAITGSYLNRYWNITQTGITGFVCDVVLQYEATDVVGLESDLFLLRVTPPPVSLLGPANTVLHQLSSAGLTSFGTFTGGPGSKTVNLKLYLEGIYAGGGLMSQAQGIAGNQFSGDTADLITIELHNAITYSTIELSVADIGLNTSGLASFSVPGAFSGSYYLTIRNRNSVATVSSVPVSFTSSIITYDFSNLATQTYASNVKNVGGVYVIYGGDVDQDGFVGVSDMGNVDNSSAIFGSGYLPEDVDGDGFVGVSDMGIVDNNSAIFISTITP
jgi:hypothetical protein